MAGDFREYFSVNKLDERALGQIEFVLNSPQYEHTFKPYLMGIADSMNALWKDRSLTRKQQYPDDFLAGGIAAIEGMIKFFDILVRETDMARIHAAAEALDSEGLYQLALDSGRLKPVLGVDQPAVPLPPDPSEDY